ncbi:MAG: hypothetical protein AABY10_04630, partial [Nanoarchaeota archaeon]
IYVNSDKYFCKQNPDKCVIEFSCQEEGMKLIENKTTCETTYRLKNECEKGNINWIEENIISCCDGINRCNIDINNPLCFESKTICREKTEVEKLMDNDCEELTYFLLNSLKKESIRKDYLKAFMQKGCQI